MNRITLHTDTGQSVSLPVPTKASKGHKMDRDIQRMHSYRVHYQPKNATIESGVMSNIRVKAIDSVDALQRAAHLLGCAVWNAERVE